MFRFKRKFQYYINQIIYKIVTPPIHLFCFIKAKYWGVKVGGKVRFLGVLSILNMNKIEIGTGARIISDNRNFVGSLQKTMFYTGQNGKIIIGKRCGISHTVIISQESIEISDDVYIGGGCCLYDNDFHSIDFDTRINRPHIIPSAPIKIKKGAFIGAHSIILKGVTIGEMSVIGAGSIVTKSVPNNELWAGVPAKKIKSI
jgi:acetyltransferase-like isoleucine patch superfamily enzyme